MLFMFFVLIEISWCCEPKTCCKFNLLRSVRFWWIRLTVLIIIWIILLDSIISQCRLILIRFFIKILINQYFTDIIYIFLIVFFLSNWLIWLLFLVIYWFNMIVLIMLFLIIFMHFFYIWKCVIFYYLYLLLFFSFWYLWNGYFIFLGQGFHTCLLVLIDLIKIDIFIVYYNCWLVLIQSN